MQALEVEASCAQRAHDEPRWLQPRDELSTLRTRLRCQLRMMLCVPASRERVSVERKQWSNLTARTFLLVIELPENGFQLNQVAFLLLKRCDEVLHRLEREQMRLVIKVMPSNQSTCQQLTRRSKSASTSTRTSLQSRRFARSSPKCASYTHPSLVPRTLA